MILDCYFMLLEKLFVSVLINCFSRINMHVSFLNGEKREVELVCLTLGDRIRQNPES